MKKKWNLLFLFAFIVSMIILAAVENSRRGKSV